jgi:hypothetical protein
MLRLNVTYDSHHVAFNYWWLFHPDDIFEYWWNDTSWDRGSSMARPIFGTRQWRKQWRKWRKELTSSRPIRTLYNLDHITDAAQITGPTVEIQDVYCGHQRITWEFPDGKREGMLTARDIRDILIQQTDPTLLIYATRGRIYVPNRSRQYATPKDYRWNRWGAEVYMTGKEVRAYEQERKDGTYQEYVPCWLP